MAFRRMASDWTPPAPGVEPAAASAAGLPQHGARDLDAAPASQAVPA